jgi:DNA processing protein
MEINNSLIYKIALSLIPGVGSINAKKLIAYTGSPEELFKAKKSTLLKIPGIGKFIVDNVVKNSNALHRAEKELNYIASNNIKVSFFTDNNYPHRLKNCDDAPVVFFYKGEIKFDTNFISIVGTRKATNYGIERCNKLVGELKNLGHNPVIVSGLAYGIDACAHKAAIKNDLNTIAVLGHGFETIYPSLHKRLSEEIIKKGALITEFVSHASFDKNNFVKRNRIVAGLSDATIVVESKKRGGALITADIANSYNRDVFAFPGRANDDYSEGCNWLIKTNRAALIEGAEDLEYQMGWLREEKVKSTIQKSIFLNLNEEEKQIVEIIKESEKIEIDQISLKSNLPVSKISSLLLNLEFEGVVRCLPGKVYILV